MTKYSFMDDYSEGCHPRILEALNQTNLEQQITYGDDSYSLEAKDLIRGLVGDKTADVHLVAGGTLANLITISRSLRSHDAVISAESGHIEIRETGAIEAVGHKILTIPTEDGKLKPDLIQTVLNKNAHFPHMARPKMVYVSNATELGTLYTKQELTAISVFCRENGLLLFMDGARLGAALSASRNDLSLKDIYGLTDVFWIGGTKAGALIGEALVIRNKDIAEDFAFCIKQRGALLAKGRLLGIQFRELFKDGLYFDLTKRANGLAAKISEAILAGGHKLAAKTETNQVFPILPNELIEQLGEDFLFYNWRKVDDNHSTLRLVTSWATNETQIESFIQALDG
jgi:threonine aldolase